MNRLIASQQEILKMLYLYDGVVDGNWGYKSQSAMAGLQNNLTFAGLKPRPTNIYFSPFEELPIGWSWEEDGSSILFDGELVVEESPVFEEHPQSQDENVAETTQTLVPTSSTELEMSTGNIVPPVEVSPVETGKLEDAVTTPEIVSETGISTPIEVSGGIEIPAIVIPETQVTPTIQVVPPEVPKTFGTNLNLKPKK